MGAPDMKACSALYPPFDRNTQQAQSKNSLKPGEQSHDRYSQNPWSSALLSDRINPCRERSRLFREIFKTPFLTGFLRARLVDSGAIVTFEASS
jgi:hypothetical protein